MMNRQVLNKPFFMMMFVLVFFFSVTSAAFAKSGTVNVGSGSLNVRAEASQTAQIIGSLANGQKVEITGTLSGWYKINYNNRVGYVSSDFVVEAKESTTQVPTSKGTVITVNGSRLNLDVEPLKENNRLLVPFRAIGEALGIEVDWDQKKQQVIAKDGDKTVIFTVNSTKILVNGKTETISPAPKIVKERTLLPLRYFSETFGANVDWNEKNNTVTIVRAESSTKPPQSISGIYAGVVNASTLNVRSQANTSSTTLGTLKKGDLVDVLDFTNQWAKITFNGREAYVHSQYLNLMNNSQQVLILGDVQVSQTGNTSKITWLKLGGGAISATQRVDGQSVTIDTNATEVARVLRAVQGLTALDVVKQGNGHQIQFTVEDGYEALMTNATGELSITVKPISEKGTGTGIKGQRIVIDAGHGDHDPGAVSNGVREKDIVLDVALRVETLLKNAGADVLMTRSNDSFLSLEERTKFANNNQADAFVSIHANAATNTSANGTETYWDKTNAAAESEELAKSIQEKLIEKLGTNDRGVRQSGFYVIKNTKMPSVLVELGFVTNPEEAKKLADNTFRQKAAEAIYEGIVEFYQ